MRVAEDHSLTDEVAQAMFERVSGKSWRSWMTSQNRAFWMEAAETAIEHLATKGAP